MTDADQEPPHDESEPVEEHEREVSPEEGLALRLMNTFTRFANRQSEIMRLASYVKERAEEIDDAKTRAKLLIHQRLTDVDESALGEILDTYIPYLTENLDDDRLSSDERYEAVAKALDEISESLPEGAMSSYIDGVTRASFMPPAVPMLYGSLLVSLVGEIETLVSSSTRALFERFPEKLEDSTRTFTWAEVSSYPTLDEFKDHAIDRAVETMLRGSLNDWLEYLEKKFQVQRSRLSKEFFANEVVQRRHAIVHAGGKASRQYIENLRSHKHDVELDDDLPVSYEYLAQAADYLYVIALSLISAAAFKHTKDEDLVTLTESFIANRCFFLLQAERYLAVKMIITHAGVDRMKDETSQLVTRVNGWIALKKLGEFDTCRPQVEAFDVYSKSNDMKLAKLALLDQVEEAHGLARRMLDSGEFPHEFWLTWPLLEDVRAYHNKLVADEVDVTDPSLLSSGTEEQNAGREES